MKHALLLLLLVIPILFISNDYQNKKIITEQQKTIEKKDSLIKELIKENQSVAVIEPYIERYNDTIEYSVVVSNIYTGTVVSDRYSFYTKDIDSAFNNINELIEYRKEEILTAKYGKYDFKNY